MSSSSTPGSLTSDLNAVSGDHTNLSRTTSSGSVYSLASFLKPGVLDDEATGPLPETCSVDLTPVDREEEKPQVVASWALSLKNLLADPNGSAMFLKYCEQLLCEENLLFWNAVDIFRTVEDDEVEAAAKDIYDEFILNSGAHQVNLNSKTAKAVKAIFKEHKPITTDMYDACQNEIFILMKTDSYAKFVKSQTYKDVLCLELSGDRLPWQEEDCTQSSQKKKGILSFLRSKDKKKSVSEDGKSAAATAAAEKKFHIHIRRKTNNPPT